MKFASELKRVLIVAPIMGFVLFGLLTFIYVLFGDPIQKALDISVFTSLGVTITWIPLTLIMNFFNKKKTGTSNTNQGNNV